PVSASQPLYRLQSTVAYDQAKQQVSQADYQFSSVQQDLILRVAQAYFDVLLAEFNVDLAVSQKAAVSENLAQAKRNFEVGVATITDTNEAQAKYDSIVAQEISARNDLDNKRTALRAIIGRAPNTLKRLGAGFEPPLPSPNSLDYWVDHARQNVEVARRAALFNAQTGFTGVNSAAASVKANEQAVNSAQVAYESNKLGQEVGVRTNLDVLNTQQNVFQARRDLAQAYFNYLIGVLRLKSAVGTLNEQDVEEVNRRLQG